MEIIKIEETRLGNYVNITNSKHKNKAYEVDMPLCMSWEANNPQPIKLTEKWLLKFGFENPKISDTINSQFFNKKNISIKFIDANNIILFFLETKIIDIYFVHQLQNLYFFLTENELTIKKS